jgi:lysophospholipase L1-like esterase
MRQAILCLVLTTSCWLTLNNALADEPAPASATVPDPDPERFAYDLRNFAARDHKNSFPHNAVLFVGSSSIRNWYTADAFPDLPVINRGFGGSQISDVLHFFDDIVTKYRPKVIVFYSGDNDTNAGKSPQQIFADFAKFVARVHGSLPETHVIALPIKPSLARWAKWSQMQQTNALMTRLDQRDDRLQLVDTATPLLGPDGQPRKELFLDDGLHLNPRGYALWNEALRPILKKALSRQ